MTPVVKKIRFRDCYSRSDGGIGQRLSSQCGISSQREVEQSAKASADKEREILRGIERWNGGERKADDGCRNQSINRFKIHSALVPVASGRGHAVEIFDHNLFFF